MAQQIAQQAAAQAATAAQTAATASTPAAAQAAAAQAAQAAQVASTVSGGSAAADQRHHGGQPGGRVGSRVRRGAHPFERRQPPGGRSGRRARRHEVPGRPLRVGWRELSRSRLLRAHHAGLGASRGVAAPLGRGPVRRFPEHVPLNALEPGDLLFYDFDGSGIDHVVMYVGPVLDGQATAYGNGTIIQAAHTGTVVTFDPVWYEGLVGAARP